MHLIRLFALLFGLFAGSVIAAGPSEGISVHGHWKIAVFDPDGSLVKEVEFDNALVGPVNLSYSMGGDRTIAGTYVVLSNTGGPAFPCNGSPCNIVPDRLALVSDTRHSTNLTQTYSGSDYQNLELAGSVTVANTTTINAAYTYTKYCADTVSPADCRSAGSYGAQQLTSKTLSPGVDVTAGQLVQVSVTLSFN